MKSKLLASVLFVLILAVGWIVYLYFLPDPLLPVPLRSATAEQAGLDWQECELPILAESTNTPAQDESLACFGYPAPVLADEEKPRSGQYIGRSDVRLTIGQDIYAAHAEDLTAFSIYTLYKNDQRVKSVVGWGDTLWLHMFLFNVDGQVAWGIANEHTNTIIYDGKDLRNVYGLDATHAAYALDGKLAFIGQKDGKYFVVHDGQKVGPDYDRITIGYCCETALYTAHGGQGRYQFRGTRDGKNYIVEISAAEQTPATLQFVSPIRDQAQATADAQIILSSTRLVPQQTPQVVLAQPLTLAEARQRIGQPTALEERLSDTPVWLVIFRGAWRIFPPDPSHTITPAPASDGCVYVLMDANDPAYSQLATIECTR